MTAEWSGTRGSCVHDGIRWLDQSVMQAKERFMYAAVRMVWYYCWVELLDEGWVLIGDWRLQNGGCCVARGDCTKPRPLMREKMCLILRCRRRSCC